MSENAQGADSYIQVPPDSTGKMTRMVAVTLPNGNTVYMQVVCMADKFGNMVNSTNDDIKELLSELVFLTRLRMEEELLV
jgi:hypothetical protein